MKSTSRPGNKLSRRKILPLLGSALVIPFIGQSKPKNIDETSIENEEEYQTLLKPDGTTVKVKTSVLKKSRVVKKKVSNKSFLDWLGRKL